MRTQRSKSFSAKKLGSLDRALRAALAYAEEVAAIVKAAGAVAKVTLGGITHMIGLNRALP